MRLRAVCFRLKRWFARHFICRRQGHDFGDVVYISPAVLTFCHNCGEEIQGRTWEDLEPMTDEDRENIELLHEIDMERESNDG